ncbi:MerR family transcriptional regulator [Kordiimonas lipolytica]|uniref:MerR family transcriptional regulator n=1 Tax=Kordiimonas lipolytica TaxID=1662421 RepID=A0ABV8U5N8_9PROT|nr:MerR family transcriptional regulator [Kordiimonas lipolytica]
MEKTMKISDFSAFSGVPSETIRYYERRGLLPAPARKPSNYRMYSKEDAARVRFLHHLQSLGLSLRQLVSLLSLCDEQEPLSVDDKSFVDAILEELDARRALSDRLETVLRELKAGQRCPDIAEKMFGGGLQ